MPTSTIRSSSNVDVDFFTGVDEDIDKLAESSNSTKPEDKLIGSLRYQQIYPINDSFFPKSKKESKIFECKLKI